MKAYALLGGPRELWPANIKILLTKAQKQGELLIGVDRGSLLLEEMGFTPALAVGDFDSLKKSELARIEKTVPDLRYSNPVKDFTDSELMLLAAFRDYKLSELTLLGASGGRLDHFLVNLLMLLNPALRPFACRVIMLDCQNLVRFYLPGKHLIKKEKGYPYFGVGALSAVKNLSIAGARYDLDNYSGDYPRIFSSNEFLPGQPDFCLSFKKGLAIVIFSKDLDRFENLQKE